MSTTVLWFRRDLRLSDHPALQAASAAGSVVPLFVLDPRLMRAGVRLDRLLASLADLREQTGGSLVVRRGDPARVIPEVVSQARATEVHVTVEVTPFGRRRDAAVERALSGVDVPMIGTGSPYAVTPGRVRNATGAPYQVFTPFFRAWRDHGWRGPAGDTRVTWVDGLASDPLPPKARDFEAGERSALLRWASFRDRDLSRYAMTRDRPDLDRTSRMSLALKYGEIHPRTLLADVADRPAGTTREDVDRFVMEMAWREFHADVLWHHPRSAWLDLNDRMCAMPYDDDPAGFDAWRAGMTGYPFIDAGMRQLRSEGWMHNRVRMVTASFLVKDLHVWWPLGARHFLDHLLDADIASNSHGWQWVAGTGTDAAPYFRIFNPVRQGLRFDPHGDYVRRWIPELRHLRGAAAHEPWKHTDGQTEGYPDRIVDHDEERLDALARLAGLTEAG